MTALENGMRAAAIAFACLVLYLCTSCTYWGPPGEQATPRLDCNGWITKGLGDDVWTFVGGSVAVAADRDPNLGRSGEAGSIYDGLQFAKFGLAIKGESEVEIAVQSEKAERILVDWGPANPDVPTSTLRFGGCGASEEWLIFAGGVWVPEPGCYEFVVRTGDRSDNLKLGLGMSC